MGVPVLTMELAVGRASRRSAVLSYKTLEKPGQKWHIHGWFCLLGCYLLMMYYTTVSGWMVSYFGKFLTGAFHSGMSTDEVAAPSARCSPSPAKWRSGPRSWSLRAFLSAPSACKRVLSA